LADLINKVGGSWQIAAPHLAKNLQFKPVPIAIGRNGIL
jgi:hypothetical protein